MKTKTINLYTYRELIDLHKRGEVTAQALDKATSWLRECAADHMWYETVYDTWTAALAQIGFENPVIQFSGFWRQGDGASFTATINMGRLAAFLSDEIAPKDCIEIDDYRPWIVHKCGKPTDKRYEWLTDIGLYGSVTRTDRHYCHENTCRASVEYREPREHAALEAVIDEYEKSAEELRYSLCKAIYRDLEAEYEYLTGEENLLELADANEYTFRIDGRAEK